MKDFIVRWIVSMVCFVYDNVELEILKIVRVYDIRWLLILWVLFCGVLVNDNLRVVYWVFEMMFILFYLKDVLDY